MVKITVDFNGEVKVFEGERAFIECFQNEGDAQTLVVGNGNTGDIFNLIFNSFHHALKANPEVMLQVIVQREATENIIQMILNKVEMELKGGLLNE